MHLRLWLAERLAEELGAVNLAGAAWMPSYARALGARVGKDVDLHSIPPVTGMLTLGDGCAVEPEVDLTGHWLDGDVVHIGRVEVGAGARVGARSTLGPGAVVGRDAEVAPGSAVRDGPEAASSGRARPPARRPRRAVRGRATARLRRPAGSWPMPRQPACISLLPLLAVLAGSASPCPLARRTTARRAAAHSARLRCRSAWSSPWSSWRCSLRAWCGCSGSGCAPGTPGARPPGWQAWVILRLLDEARTWLFPIYAST